MGLVSTYLAGMISLIHLQEPDHERLSCENSTGSVFKVSFPQSLGLAASDCQNNPPAPASLGAQQRNRIPDQGTQRPGLKDSCILSLPILGLQQDTRGFCFSSGCKKRSFLAVDGCGFSPCYSPAKGVSLSGWKLPRLNQRVGSAAHPAVSWDKAS